MELHLVTARYLNKRLARDRGAKIRATIGAPKFPLRYELAASIPELMPTWSMFGLPESEFIDRYRELLESRGGVEVLRNRFSEIATATGASRLILL